MAKTVLFICNNYRTTANDKTPPMIGEFGIGKYLMYFKKGSVGKIFYLGVAVLLSYPFCSKTVITAWNVLKASFYVMSKLETIIGRNAIKLILIIYSIFCTRN